MQPATLARLSQLNRIFYQEHALAFAESRPRLAPGARQVLARIPPGMRLLEAGCGDGKAARALAAERPPVLYLGLDLSPVLLDRAATLTLADPRLSAAPASPPPGYHSAFQLANPKSQIPNTNLQDPASSIQHPAYDLQSPASNLHQSAIPNPHSEIYFHLADLTTPSWPSILPPEPFNWALALAVFHHLPGEAVRLAAMRALAGALKPGGTLALSNWQFTRQAGFERRLAPWAATGLSEAEVEPGDFLLTWQRAGRSGLRYLHLLDLAEVERLGRAAGLTLLDSFQSDGGSGDLADYAFLGKSG